MTKPYQSPPEKWLAICLRCRKYLDADYMLTSKGGKKNGLFEPLIYKNERFTKTGSGQT
jgi:hypothetical protein